MKYTESEVLQFVEENDVKFVKLAFCDVYGNMLNISVLSGELRGAFQKGVVFSPAKVSGFDRMTDSDLLLFPDPSTLVVLPWRPQQGRVIRLFCNIFYPDGTRFEGDGRYVLERAIEKAKGRGYLFQIGTSCEFYVTKTDSEGRALREPYDYAGYCSAAPEDKGENLRRDVSLTLEAMDLQPVSSRHESGPGQSEIDFRASGALNAADNFITFKSVVKIIAERNGAYATFMPKPFPESCGSGMHLSISVLKNGRNILNTREFSAEAQSMTAGLQNSVRDMTLFLNPTTNSYLRLGENLAPKYLSWSHGNYAQLIRVVLGENGKLILRSPDSLCNPYIVFALVIEACLDGMDRKCALGVPVNFDLRYATEDQVRALETIPATLDAAVETAQAEGAFPARCLPKTLLDAFLAKKRETCAEYEKAKDKFEYDFEKYFYFL